MTTRSITSLMLTVPTALLLAAAALLSVTNAAETIKTQVSASAPGMAPVAIIDGTAITIRQIENNILAKEGRDTLNQWLFEALSRVDWARMPDDAVVLTIGDRALTRRDLSIGLLEQHAAQVREEMIGVTVVRNALTKAGITINDALVEKEWQRMDREFQRTPEARQQKINFEQYLQATKNTTKAQFLGEEGVRAAAGLHELVEQVARLNLTDAVLLPWFEARHEQYDQPAAVDLSTLYLAYRVEKGEDGKSFVPPDAREVVFNVVRECQRQIQSGSASLAVLHQAMGRRFEKDADANGRIGWIERNGKRVDNPSARVLPPEVMDQVWNHPLPATGGVLLAPIAHASGVDLIQIHARRAGRPAVYAEIKERVFQERLSEEMKDRTTKLLGQLRRNADIRYLSMPDAIDTRRPPSASASAAAPAR